MHPLRTILTAFAERPDVLGAAIVSDEGLLVESALPERFDAEAIAALAASVQTSAPDGSVTSSSPSAS